MKILIDGRQSLGGMERYTRGLIRLLAAGLDDEIAVYGGSDAAHPADIRQRTRLRAALGDFRRVLTDQYTLPRAARRQRSSVLHSVNYFVPWRLSIPCVVTCHDLWLLDHVKDKQAGWIRHYERSRIRHGLRHADHIIAVSDAVAETLRERFGFDRRRVSVVYPPVPDLARLSPPADPPLPDGRPYFLAVGTLEPRKNLERLVEAHHLAWHECGIPLILVGPYGWKQKSLLDRIRRSPDAVRWLGAVPDAALAALYQSATALIAFSRDEGFDYPTVEALSFGTPVVLSDIPVHREIVGSLGRYASPDRPEALAEQLLHAAGQSPASDSEFRAAARQRLVDIHERGSAERYREVYRRVVDD